MRGRAALTIAAAVVAAAAAWAGAPAANGAAAALTCPEAGKQHFLPWLDPLFYRLADGGSLESTEGWRLSGGAKLAAGNEPYYLNSPADRSSLSLPAGSSATSPWSCVAADGLTMRFFAVNSGSLLSTLEVDLLYRTKAGTVRTLGGVDAVTALTQSAWFPTLPVVIELDTVAADLLVTDLGATQVAFRFTPSSRLLTSGKWRIDDVYVDPLLVWW